MTGYGLRPVMVKPRVGGSSVGMSLVRREEDLGAAHAHAGPDSGITGPLLYLVGEDDMLIHAGQRAQIRGGLKAAGMDHEVISYPGVQHAFFWAGYAAVQPGGAGRRVDQDPGPARQRFTRRQHGFTWIQHFRAIPELLRPARGTESVLHGHDGLGMVQAALVSPWRLPRAGSRGTGRPRLSSRRATSQATIGTILDPSRGLSARTGPARSGRGPTRTHQTARPTSPVRTAPRCTRRTT